MNTASLHPGVQTDLKKWLEGREFGTTKVETVIPSTTQDEDGEPAIYLRLILGDPSGETWPVDDIMELQRAIISRTVELGVNETTYISIEPITDPPQADDEELRYG